MFAAPSFTKIPLAPLPEIRFREPAAVPPIALPGASWIVTPSAPFPRPCAPVTSVPMKLPCKTLPVAAAWYITTPLNPLAEIVLRAPDAVPPMTFRGLRFTAMPEK